MAIAETLKALKESGDKIVKLQDELIESEAVEGRDVTTGPRSEEYEKSESDYKEIEAKIANLEANRKLQVALRERAERMRASDIELDDRGRPLDFDKHGRLNRDFMETGEANEECRELGLLAFLSIGSGRLSERQQTAAEICGVNLHGGDYEFRLPIYKDGHLPTIRELRNGEQRISLVGDDSTGGFWAPESFVAQLEIAMLQFGGMRGVSTMLRTQDGNLLTLPSSDDTANEGSLVGEGQASATNVNITAAGIKLGAYNYTSNAALLTSQLMRDAAIDVVAEVGRMLGERLGRVFNRHTTTGNGAERAEGIAVGAPIGKTAASATVLTDLELLDLKHSVDPAYRDPNFNPTYMFNDNTLLALKKLVDGVGRRLWQVGMTAGDPGTIDGDPYVINQHMASIAANNTSVIYGALKKYHIREVRTVRLHRLVERDRIEFDADTFVAFMSMDGKLRDAGTNPVKRLVQAA